MEGLIILLVLGIIFLPITLSIIAVVRVANLREELRQIRCQIQANKRSASNLNTVAPPKPKVAPVIPKEKTITPSVPTPTSVPKSESSPLRKVPASQKPKMKMEFLMGGKAAAFAGISILITGVVFLVGYAIQRSWLGPEIRVSLGLLAGGVLVGLGHFVGQKHEKYALFSRVLTGGGSALFYFTVFSAYAFYHLIGAVAAGAGLLGCALAVFGLAMVYGAQSVGVLGVLGAFVTPLLIGGELDAGSFFLIYAALINVPVIFLGIRRKWQLLYNLSFVFTVIYFLIWWDETGGRLLWSGLGFALLYFLQYAALGLLKLRCEQKVAGRSADMIRLVLASGFLLMATYGLLDEAGKNEWIGGVFLLLALLHVALAQFAYKVLTRFNGEILAFLAGGLAFATLALPAQLDGEWVSLGWALEGVALAWFATRVSSRILQAAALGLGIVGMMKGLLFDVRLYSSTPTLFLNARFLVGMVSAGLLGVQGKLAMRFPEEKENSLWQDSIWWVGVLGAIGVFFADTFWTLGAANELSWLLTSAMLLVVGVAVIGVAPRNSSVIWLGSVLLLLVPCKLLLVDAWWGVDVGGYRMTPFGNVVIWSELLMLLGIVGFVVPRVAARELPLLFKTPTYSLLLNLASVASAIGMVSMEISRKSADWASMAITILWAVSALILILLGMKRRQPAYRYFGLILFGIATLKVLIFDSSELDGLERIFAFMGTGVLLLVLSFAYQKASSYFQAGEKDL